MSAADRYDEEVERALAMSREELLCAWMNPFRSRMRLFGFLGRSRLTKTQVENGKLFSCGCPITCSAGGWRDLLGVDLSRLPQPRIGWKTGSILDYSDKELPALLEALAEIQREADRKVEEPGG